MFVGVAWSNVSQTCGNPPRIVLFPGTASRLILVMRFLDRKCVRRLVSPGVSLLEPTMLVLARRAIFD